MRRGAADGLAGRGANARSTVADRTESAGQKSKGLLILVHKLMILKDHVGKPLRFPILKWALPRCQTKEPAGCESRVRRVRQSASQPASAYPHAGVDRKSTRLNSSHL